MSALNIEVIGSSGKGAKARVGGQVSGPLGGHVDGGYTDNNGHGVLEWSSGSSLDTIYIDGKANKGKYTRGGTYIFNK